MLLDIALGLLFPAFYDDREAGRSRVTFAFCKRTTYSPIGLVMGETTPGTAG